MDHGIVDWQKFLGDKTAIKFDLVAERVGENGQEEFINKYFKDATLQKESDLKFGNLNTFQYNTPDAINDQLVRSYVAFIPDGRVVFASLFVKNQPVGIELKTTSEWNELKDVFASFEYSEE